MPFFEKGSNNKRQGTWEKKLWDLRYTIYDLKETRRISGVAQEEIKYPVT